MSAEQLHTPCIKKGGFFKRSSYGWLAQRHHVAEQHLPTTFLAALAAVKYYKSTHGGMRL